MVKQLEPTYAEFNHLFKFGFCNFEHTLWFTVEEKSEGVNNCENCWTSVEYLFSVVKILGKIVLLFLTVRILDVYVSISFLFLISTNNSNFAKKSAPIIGLVTSAIVKT